MWLDVTMKRGLSISAVKIKLGKLVEVVLQSIAQLPEDGRSKQVDLFFGRSMKEIRKELMPGAMPTAVRISVGRAGSLIAALIRALAQHVLRLRLGVQDRVLPPPRIDEPVAELRHPESGDFAELLFLVLRWVGVRDVIVEPLFEDVRCPFG